MRRAFLVVLAASGCGSSPPPAPEMDPHLQNPMWMASLQGDSQPCAGPQEERPDEPEIEIVKVPLWDRLHDPEGPIAGLPGFSIVRKQDVRRCGGIAIITARARGKIAEDDQPFVDVLNLECPSNLSFDPNPKNKTQTEVSMRRFNAFVERARKVMGTSTTYYQNKLATGDAVTQAVARGRMLQISARLASVFARCEMPRDVRTGEYVEDKKRAFCAALADAAEPLQKSADDARAAVCATSNAANGGWWDGLCEAKQ